MYYYTMERMLPLTDEEEYDIDEFIDYGKHSCRNKTLRSFTQKLDKRRFFIDCHAGNVMKTKDGKYKIIDVEGISFRKLRTR